MRQAQNPSWKQYKCRVQEKSSLQGELSIPYTPESYVPLLEAFVIINIIIISDVC